MCCSDACLQPTLCANSSSTSLLDAMDPGKVHNWTSPDPRLAALGVRFLQIGGDVWNRCGHGWLNVDSAFDAGDGVPGPNMPVDDKSGRMIMRHWVHNSSRLPLEDASVLMVYSEHMLEHMLPWKGGINILREAYRVLAPGGLLRIVTPDLAKYTCDHAEGGARGFLRAHGARFAPMQRLNRSGTPSLASVINNIFHNYAHKWIYDFDELVLAASRAGISPSQVCRSDRSGLGLGRWARSAIHRATHPRNRKMTCWIDQAVREDESMYVVLRKPDAAVRSRPVTLKPDAAAPSRPVTLTR
jgi:SAM-dependent methyltransferase